MTFGFLYTDFMEEWNLGAPVLLFMVSDRESWKILTQKMFYLKITNIYEFIIDIMILKLNLIMI